MTVTILNSLRKPVAVCTKNPVRVDDVMESPKLLCFVLAVLASPFKSKLRLKAENAVLRHKLIVLSRRLHGRVRLTNHDRWFFIQLYRWFPPILKVLTTSSPRRSCVGIAPVFAATGAGSRALREGRPQIDTACAR